MRGMLDFSSWSTALTTLVGLILVSLVMVGVRLAFMQSIQRRREREDRQINERLKVLVAAYKTDAVLGPSLGAYTRQVALYAEGIRRATGEPAEAVLKVAKPSDSAAGLTRPGTSATGNRLSAIG